MLPRMQARGIGPARDSFYPEFDANAKAKEEEENGAEDNLNGGEDFQRSGQACDRGNIKKILFGSRIR